MSHVRNTGSTNVEIFILLNDLAEDIMLRVVKWGLDN